jgi:RHS repeat-associated protein
VPLDSKADNSIVASTSATTLADHSPSSDTVLNVGLDQNIMWSFSYNANGDLTEKLETVHNSAVQWSYCYSVDGWLTKATKIVDSQTVFTEQYWYDPIGRKYKTATTVDEQTTTRYFAYDGGSIVLELAEVGEGEDKHYELEKEHVRGLSLGGGIGGLLYTRDADGTTGYFHYDGRGNVVSITNAAREEIAYYEYDAWGSILTACGSLANEFAFSTKQASLGTGLIDFGYRHYDPSTARWTRRDPIGLFGGLNLYAYLYSTPTHGVDPDGRGPINWILTGNWNAKRNELCGWWEGFRDSLFDQQESMSQALFGPFASWVYGVPNDPLYKQYGKSAWGQSEGTWAEIPTKAAIGTAAAATVGIIICEVGPPLVHVLARAGTHIRSIAVSSPWLQKGQATLLLILYRAQQWGCRLDLGHPRGPHDTLHIQIWRWGVRNTETFIRLVPRFLKGLLNK